MQSSIKYRPRTLDGLIGQQRLVRLLRGAYAKNKLSQAFLLIGEKGSGKTTLARIIALSVQCTHQTMFGRPCKECRRKRNNFPIFELNCGKVRGVEEIEQFISTAEYDIIGEGKRKVFILDEAHRLSGHAQDALLVPFEKQDKNLWIICSTRPEKIVDTIRSRCQVYTLKPLDRDEIEQLVKYLLDKEQSQLAVNDLADALSENGIVSGRLIANAVDKYISGATAEEAADVEGATSISSKALIRATIKGAWPDVSAIIKKAPASDVRLLRAAVVGYLRTILLDSPEIDSRTTIIAKAITRLVYINQAEDTSQLAALSAELYTLCKLFMNNSL